MSALGICHVIALFCLTGRGILRVFTVAMDGLCEAVHSMISVVRY